MVMPTVEERRCTGYQAISELLRGMAEESDVTKFYSDVIGGVTIYALFSDGNATPFSSGLKKEYQPVPE